MKLVKQAKVYANRKGKHFYSTKEVEPQEYLI